MLILSRNRLCMAVLVLAPNLLHPQTQTQNEPAATVLAVVKDWASLAGNIGGWPDAVPPQVPVELIANVTASGNWIDLTLQCRYEDNSGCAYFLKHSLNRARRYTVITAPNQSETVVVSPVTQIGDCYEYSSSGTLSRSQAGNAAIAADAPDLFDTPPKLQTASPSEIAIVHAGLLHLGPQQVQSTSDIQVRKAQLEGETFFIAERHSTAKQQFGIVFAIGRIQQGQFKIARWNEQGGENGDTVESVLGVIRLKNGREFLLTTESDPEGHRFYVYGVKNGMLQMVFKGGGSSC
jgi:hypothetical protein